MITSQLLEGIDVMLAIVDARSFGRAGEALGLSQSGVSRAVARLEARLGLRLFERTTRSVRLTDEGRRFHAQVVPLLGALQDATANAQDGATAVRGRLRVNVDPFFSRIVLASHVATFLEQHPQVKLELIMRDHVGDLVADGFDLALRFGDPPSGSFVARKLVETRILTVASPSYIATHGRPKHPADVADHACIAFYDAANGRAFDWEFRKGRRVLPVNVASRLLVSDVGAMLSASEAGSGIAQIMQLGAGDLIESGKLVELFPDWSGELFPLYALYPSRQHRAAKVSAFVDFCLKVLARSKTA